MSDKTMKQIICAEIRPDIIQGIEEFVQHGVPPGGFLRAVLSNDLMEAMGRADIDNRPALHAICSYLYNYVPASCYGSKAIVNAWIERKADERLKAAST